MDYAAWIALGGLLVTVFTMFGGGIWTIAIVKATTDSLKQAIREQTKATRELRTTIEDIQRCQYEHESRLMVLESHRRERD